MENKEELDYIVKYKNEAMKIKKKYIIKIMQYLMPIPCILLLLVSIFSIIFFETSIVGTIITVFLMILSLFGFLAGNNCYLYFDKKILKVQNALVSYKIPIENLLNINIEKNNYQKSIKIQYVENSKIKTIKVIAENYIYTRRDTKRFNEHELQRFLSLFKTEKECKTEKIDNEYLTINRNYSYDELKQMLTDKANKKEPDLPAGIESALAIGIIVLIAGVACLIYMFQAGRSILT